MPWYPRPGVIKAVPSHNGGGRAGDPTHPSGIFKAERNPDLRPADREAIRSMIEGGAISALHGYSEGNPRKIDNLMTDALTIGAQQEKTSIDAEVILAAANNQSLT